MNYHQQLAETINDFMAIELSDKEKFFIDPVMKKLITIHDLMIFPYIEHDKFQQYMGWFRNDIRKDINRCLNSGSGDSPAEKQELLNGIKSRIQPKLKVVEYAFAFFLKNRELLKKDSPFEITRLKQEVNLQLTG